MKTRTLSASALMMLAAATLWACGSDESAGDPGAPAKANDAGSDSGDSGYDDSGDDSSGSDECTPGDKTSCSCAEGAPDGSKTCDSDGSGYSRCECASAGGKCDIAPACQGISAPPASLTQYNDLNIPKMQAVSRQMLQQRLVNAVSDAGVEMRVLAASLDGEEVAGEPVLVTALRAAFAEQPQAAAALKRQLELAGMPKASVYRATNPVPTMSKLQELTSIVPESILRDEDASKKDCGKPMLRMGISKVMVHEEEDDIANDRIYCTIQSEGAKEGEIRVTPQTPPLDEGTEYIFGINETTFWGQKGPKAAQGDLSIKYSCIESEKATGFLELLEAIKKAAAKVDGTQLDERGWLVKVVSAVATIAQAGLSLDGDDHLFEATQTITEAQQLELTNGGYWTIRRDGKHLWSDWDWEFTIQAWGCAEKGLL